MTRFAFLVAPLHGHVQPTLAVARELVARGDEVAYWLPEAFEEGVTATGARLCTYRPSGRTVRALSPDPVARFAAIPFWLSAEARAVLPQVIGDVRTWQPDIAVVDVLCPWGHVAARALDVPAATLCTSYAMNERFSLFDSAHGREVPRSPEAVDRFLDDARALHEGYGVTLDLRDLFFPSGPLTVVFTPRAFHPAGETFRDGFVFVGPSVPRPGAAARPLLAALPGGRPTVYVSMGTVFGDWPELPPACLHAFSDDRWQAVVAVPDARAEDRGNVLVRPHVPQWDLLSSVDVFVTHGGMGSTMEALAAGVPLVVVPQTPEQAITADRVAELGLGVTLDRAATTGATLRAAVDRVAVSSQIRRAVDRAQADARAAGGYRAAADALQALARRQRGANVSS